MIHNIFLMCRNTLVSNFKCLIRVLSYFLGIEALQSSKGYYLSQSRIEDLIARSHISDNHTAGTLMDIYLKLRPSDGRPLHDASRYHHIVGNLVYLTITRPDIAHEIHILS
jgi:hypothetical protein